MTVIHARIMHRVIATREALSLYKVCRAQYFPVQHTTPRTTTTATVGSLHKICASCTHSLCCAIETSTAHTHGLLHRVNKPPLAFRVSHGDGDARCPGLMLCVGLQSVMDSKKSDALAEDAKRRGQSVVRFDYRGHGLSGGQFDKCLISDWLCDALDVMDTVCTGPQVLVGVSLGGWIAQLVASKRPASVVGLVLLCPATDFTCKILQDPAVHDKLKAVGRYQMPSEYTSSGSITLSRMLIEDGNTHLLLNDCPADLESAKWLPYKPVSIHCPVHILHGLEDTTVPWEDSVNLAKLMCSADVIVELVKAGDHRLSRECDVRRLLLAVKHMSNSLVRQSQSE